MSSPLDKIEAYRTRMGWTLPWVSALDPEFGQDFQFGRFDTDSMRNIDALGTPPYYAVKTWPLTRKIIEAYRAYGDDAAAETLLVRYIAGDPQNTDALLLLARNSAGRDDWLRVQVLLDTAIGLGAGNDLEVLALRAEAASQLGREEEAARFDALRTELKPAAFVAD